MGDMKKLARYLLYLSNNGIILADFARVSATSCEIYEKGVRYTKKLVEFPRLRPKRDSE